MKEQSFVIRELFCTQCGSVFPIPRRKARLRENNHIKHIWCYKCKRVTAHTERSSYTGTKLVK